jgi:putative Holliday junction resolvase
MPIVEPADLPDRLGPRQRLLGLDLGTKTIGLAISDPGLVVASPLETIRRKKFTADAGALFALVDDHGVGALVIGLPRNMDGSEGPRCQSTRQFAANLLGKRDIAIAFWDERLSTAAVERAMIAEGDVSRAKRAEAVDKLAAGYILQGYLDSLRRR